MFLKSYMKVGIFIADSNGCYPVPAVKGGAVSTLVEHLVKANNEKRVLEMEIITYYDKVAAEMSSKYPNVHFIWIKVPGVIKFFDKLLLRVIRKVFKKKKAMSFMSFFSLIYYVLSCSVFLRKNAYDKVILENNVLLAWIIRLSRYKGKYYYHFHNVPRVNGFCKSVFNNCSSILCVSNYVGQMISSSQSVIGKISSNKIRVLYNCIDVNHFKPVVNEKVRNEYRIRLGIKQDDIILIYVGRLSPEKGIDKFIKSLELIKDSRVKALIVGKMDESVDYEFSVQLQDMFKNMGSRLIFAGYIQQEELPYVYSLAQIAVFPSVWDEPAGLTMIEAMSCKLPVITTDSGGIMEYVSRYAITLKRDKDLIPNIALCIQKFIDDDNLRKTYAINGMHHIQHSYSEERYLSKFIACIS